MRQNKLQRLRLSSTLNQSAGSPQPRTNRNSPAGGYLSVEVVNGNRAMFLDRLIAAETIR